MTKNSLKFILIAALLTIFFSCSRDEEKDFAFTHLHLNYYEQFYTHGRELVFLLETMETFPCNNFQINTLVNVTATKLEIRTDNIDVPNVCITTVGPATKILNLGYPDQQPQTTTLWVNNSRHDFELGIHEDYYDITRLSHFENKLSFSSDKLMRIPEHTVWGYILTDSPEKSDIINDLMELFQTKGAQPIVLENGDYHYFKVLEDVPVFKVADHEAPGFSLWFDQPMEVLVNAFEDYIENTDSDTHIQLRIYSTRGERYII